MSKSLLERLADKVLIGDDCWEWTAARDRDGYGILTNAPGARSAKAHRIMYELLVGPIPDGLAIDHLCRNRGCIRPSHMEPVANGENVLRGESLQAKNKAKTHCLNGHAFDEGNTYHYVNSKTGTPARMCRACGRDAMRRRRALAKAV